MELWGPYKWPKINKSVTGVLPPINGVITPNQNWFFGPTSVGFLSLVWWWRQTAGFFSGHQLVEWYMASGWLWKGGMNGMNSLGGGSHQILLPSEIGMSYFWSNYSDLTRPHPKWWLSKGNPLISGKPRLVKYYLARYLSILENFVMKEAIDAIRWRQLW